MDLSGMDKRKGGFDWKLPVVLLVVCVLLLTLWFREGTSGPLHTVRKGFTVVTTPIAQIGAALAVPFVALGNVFTNATAGSDDLTSLREQNDELNATVIRLQEYQQEVDRLNALLQLKDAYDIEGVAARVIAQDSDSWNQVITINKGTDAGVSAGMPVMDANGLIGQIEQVTGSSSTVRLITDAQSGVAALVQSTRVEGIVTGSLEGLLYLSYVPVSTQVTVGDAVITSGSGGVYPRGIVIGTIISVQGDSSALYHTIVVKPVASSDDYEDVLVLTGDETEVSSTTSSNTAANTTTMNDLSANSGATSSTSGEN
jgi:rod shape-determining protein MreC